MSAVNRGSDQAPSWLRRAMPYLLVLAIGAVVLLPRLGDFGFWDPWEPKYAQAAQEMIQRDSYIVPYYRGEARLAKPILTYWSIILGTSIAGVNEFGARIGGVFFALVGALALCYSVARVRSSRAGILAGIVLLTLPQYSALARQATTDIYLLIGLGLSLVFLALGIHTAERRRRHLCASYVCLAISVLAKGPLVSGAIYGATLAVLLVTRIDWEYLRSASLRKIAISFALFSSASGAGLAALVAIGGLFGTSPEHWGWDPDVHSRLLSLRSSIHEVQDSLKLTHFVLLGSVLAPIVIMFRWRHNIRLVARSHAVLMWLWALSIVVGAGWAWGLAPQTHVAATCGVAIIALLGCYVVLSVQLLRLVELPEGTGRLVRLFSQQALWMTGILAVIAGPWYVAILIEKSQLFVNDFVVYNHISRATDTINKTGDSEYYWETIVFALFPWSCLIPAVLGSVLYSRRLTGPKNSNFESSLLFGIVLVLATFSSSTTKFAHYIAPMLIPAAALFGITLDRIVSTKSRLARHVAWFAALVIYLPLATDLVSRQGIKYVYRTFTVKSHVPGDMSPNPALTTLVVSLGIALAVALVWNSRKAIAVLTVSSIAFTFYISVVFTPALSRNKTMKNLCESWKSVVPREQTLGFVGPVKYSVFYYCGQRVTSLEPPEFVEFMNPAGAHHSIVYKKELKSVSRHFGQAYEGHSLRVIDDSHFAYVLVSSQGAAGHAGN